MNDGDDRLRVAAERWGTPLYVVDLQVALRNFAAYRTAFPGALIAYALKANPDHALVRRLVDEGAGCEVVNGVELQLALRAGCPPDRIVMNGVGKTDDDLGTALDAECLINVESLDELHTLLALDPPPTLRIGLRLNPGLAPETHRHLATGAADAKFGVALSRLPAALDRLQAFGRRPAAVGAHIGSDIISLDPYRELIGRLAAMVADLPHAAVDLGGGLADADANRLGLLADAVRSGLPGRQLILEPGRSLVADAGWLVTRVVRVQRTVGPIHLVTDAGMTELIRPMLYGAQHPLRLVGPGEPLEPKGHPVALSGPVCEAGDTLVSDVARWLTADVMRGAGPGALLAIGRAGAYGASMASNYNGRLRPAQVVLDGDELQLSVRRETLDDLVARDV